MPRLGPPDGPDVIQAPMAIEKRTGREYIIKIRGLDPADDLAKLRKLESWAGRGDLEVQELPILGKEVLRRRGRSGIPLLILDARDLFPELLAWGFIDDLKVEYEAPNIRIFTIGFKEVPPPGRLYLNKTPDMKVVPTDSLADWSSPAGGSLSVVTENIHGQSRKAIKATLSLTAGTSAQWFLVLEYRRPDASLGNLKLVQGFRWWIKLSSLANLDQIAYRLGKPGIGAFLWGSSAGVGEFRVHLPPEPNLWVQYGSPREEWAAAGSPAWDDLNFLRIWLMVPANSTFAGDFYFSSLEAPGYSQEAKLSDLDLASEGEDIPYPASANFGYDFDRAGKRIALEAILWNKRKYVHPQLLSPTNTTSNWYFIAGSGTMAVDTRDYVEGIGSIAITSPTSDANGAVGISYNPPGTWNLSKVDYLIVHLKAGGDLFTKSTAVHVRLVDALGKARWWDVKPLISDGRWARIVLPLRTGFAGEDAGFAIDNVGAVWFLIQGLPASQQIPGDFKINWLAVDYGNWIILEQQIPDIMRMGTSANALSGAPEVIRALTWDGSAYQAAYSPDADVNWYSSRTFLLDGQSFKDIYGEDSYSRTCASAYYAAKRGRTARSRVAPDMADEREITRPTASQAFGAELRFLCALLMPPHTGARDASGAYALDKMRMRLEALYERESATWID